MTLLAHGPKLTSRPAAGYILTTRSLSSWDSQVDNLLAQMTLDEKVGQMTQAERGSLDSQAEDIRTYFLGSILSGGGSGPAENQVDAWSQMYDRFQSKALQTRLKIPILYGIDAVHGHNNIKGAAVFPHNIGLGATRNPDLVEKAARITASEVRATGMNWTFSPCVTVPRDERWGRTYEGFGEDPGLVRLLSEAAVRGYQGGDLKDAGSISACAKHYVGDGGTTGGKDQGNTEVDETTLRAIHLPGYLGALDAGVATIMVSFSSWNGVKLSAHGYLMTDVLKNELGFEGFLVSDWAAIDQLPGDYRAQVKASVSAGMDMFMVPYRHREFYATLRSLVQAGEVPVSRIDDAVRRILRVKFAAGLFDRSPLTDPAFKARFGSVGHREVAREAVRQSVVLLQNQGGILPLAKNIGRIHVAGKNADNIGNQCGGWTIEWQGKSGDITPGTTILEAVRHSVSPATTVSFSIDGSGASGADVGIAVIGETPYAEGPGDDADLSLAAQDVAVVDRMRQAGTRVIVILISGRPMLLDPILGKVEAVLAAWLPGTEGQGVTDVVFGDFRPTGKLPCSWPKDMSQIPINVGDAVYDPLFPYGFGLTY
ncbi:MAG: beta-glucosidase [Acidobacteria bacterium]|nr:MAG: beta-glucosidase [Acidobacteriota bacterium]